MLPSTMLKDRQECLKIETSIRYSTRVVVKGDDASPGRETEEVGRAAR